jgi:type II secretory pathway pseudopilin PulG
MSIVVALFVIVVVASLAAFAVTVGGAQSQTQSASLQTSRALAAARTGLHWGLYRTRTSTWCNTPGQVQTISLTEGALRGFNVRVTCDGYPHTAGAATYYSYDIGATSNYGAYGSVDFASRYVSARYFSPGY